MILQAHNDFFRNETILCQPTIYDDTEALVILPGDIWLDMNKNAHVIFIKR